MARAGSCLHADCLGTETTMKKVLLVVLVLFLGFYLMRDPVELASFAQNAGVALWLMLSTLFEAVIDFLDALLG
jgi:hypothetical protein